MSLKCFRCQKDCWDPLKPCDGCGYTIKETLSDPSPYQLDEKYPKHGLYFDGNETVVHPNSVVLKPEGSKFYPGLNIDELYVNCMASGCTIVPVSPYRVESVMFSTSVPVGEGYLFGEKRVFNSFRVVRIDNEKFVHAYPDMIHTDVDKEVVCTKCGRSYLVTDCREVCKCDRPLSTAYFRDIKTI